MSISQIATADASRAIREFEAPSETKQQARGRNSFALLNPSLADDYTTVAKDFWAASQHARNPDEMFTALVNAADELGEYSAAILQHLRRQMIRGML